MLAKDDEDDTPELSHMSRALATHAYRNILKEKALGTYQGVRSHGDIISEAQNTVLTKKSEVGRETVRQSARRRRNHSVRNYVETKAELEYWDINDVHGLDSPPTGPHGDAQDAMQDFPTLPEAKTSFLPSIGMGMQRPNPDPQRSSLQLPHARPALIPLKIPPMLTTRSTANSPVLAIFGRWKHYDDMVSEGDKMFMDLTAMRQAPRLKPLPCHTQSSASPLCQPAPQSYNASPSPLPAVSVESPVRKSDHADKSKKTLGWKRIDEEMQLVERALDAIRTASLSSKFQGGDQSKEQDAQGPSAKLSPLPHQGQTDSSVACGKMGRTATLPPAPASVQGRSKTLGGMNDRMCWSSLDLVHTHDSQSVMLR